MDAKTVLIETGIRILAAVIILLGIYIFAAYMHTPAPSKTPELTCTIHQGTSAIECIDEAGESYTGTLNRVYDRCEGNRWGWKPKENSNDSNN